MEIPVTWETVTLDEISVSRMGKTILAKELSEKGIPVYSAGAGNEEWGYVENSDVTFGENTLVISARGNIGAPKRPRHSVFVSTQTTIATTFFIADIVEFYFYFLNSYDFGKHSSQTTIPMLRVSDVNKIEVPVPPINEQHRIVAKIEELFSELDKGIENLKTAREQLKVYRQALLKHAFEGKLTAQWRAANPDKLEPAATLLARIQTEREQRYRQQLQQCQTTGGSKPKAPKPLPPLTAEELAELPELPEGWGWIRLGEVFADSPKNGIYKSADNYGTGFSIIRIDDFYDGALSRMSGFKKVRLSADEIQTFTAHVGDILINRVNSIEYLGKCCEIKGLAEPVVFESNIMKTTLAANLVSNYFVTSYLSSYFGRRRLCANAKHAVNQASINQTDVAMTPIPLAQMEEQIAIAEHLAANLSEADQLDQILATSLQQSEALRQSILKKAFAGQLVAQDANDEPAAALLARILAEKQIGNQGAKKSVSRSKRSE